MQVQQLGAVLQGDDHAGADKQHGENGEGHGPVQHAGEQIEVAWAIHLALPFWTAG